jgi:gliding motility-associated-like protein
MMNAHDRFERAVKETLEEFEVPYNSADWAQLEARLDNPGGTTSRKSHWGLTALLIGGSAVLGTAWYLTRTPDAELAGDTVTKRTALAPVEAEEVATTSTELAMQPMDARGQAPNAASTAHASNAAQHAHGAKGPQANAARHIPKQPATSSVAPSAEAERTDVVSIRASITEGCPGTAIDFAAENLPNEGIYLWNFGDGSFSNKARPSHVFSKAGTFEVMLSHSSVGGSSVKNKPVADRIVIHETPKATFSFLKQEYENSVPSVHFENRSQGAMSYHWDFGDGHTSTVAHPDHIYKRSGDHTVVLTVTNAKGCMDRMERTVHVAADYNLLAPTTFSPNGDGVDDVFVPEALKSLGVRFKLSIHDPRTGQLVYESSDASRPWNGRVGNKGDLCQTGDYVWMVEMKDGEKLGGTYNGTVGLLR